MPVSFDRVTRVGLTLPGVETASRYDGAEPDTLVVRAESEDRARMLEDAPDTYYLTEYYERHPVVLARLGTPHA